MDFTAVILRLVAIAATLTESSVEVTFDAREVSGLEASFYRLDEDDELRQAARRVSIDRPQTVRIAAGPYLLSLAARGWAPDLRVLEAGPGTTHAVRYRRLDGWSVVLRTIADSDGAPVGNAEVELWSLPGFDEAGRADPEPRRLLKRRSDAAGLVVVSGLRVPMAAATLSHERFVETRLPALSSENGTFRVFEARLQSGGRLEARVLYEGRPAADARCELAPPDLGTTLLEARTDAGGLCRSTKIPAGRYALRVTLPKATTRNSTTQSATTVLPLVIADGEATDPTVELRPITVTGTVYLGLQGVPGYEVVFNRTDSFNLDASAFPVGRTTTGEEGDYELVLWAAGDYVAQVRTESTGATNFRSVALEADETVDFQLSAAEIKGQVVDTLGAPRPNASVYVRGGNSLRTVVLDGDARFRVPFPDIEEVAELRASEHGYYPTDSVNIRIAPGITPEPVTLVLRPRGRRSGRAVLASGRPAAGTWVRAYRLGPDGVPAFVERTAADASGRIEVSSEKIPLRLFYGGPGCPLGVSDLAPSAEEEPFEIRCRQPSHILVRLVSDDLDVRSAAPLLIRRGDIIVPLDVLSDHLHTLGLPSTTDGQGRLGLVALEPGHYDIFHGKGTSILNLAAGHEVAYLTSVSLGVKETVDVALTVDLHR